MHCRLRPLPCTSLLGILSSLLLGTGCAHRTPAPGGSYTLEEASGYSLLVPSLSSPSANPAFQTSNLVLPSHKRRDTSDPDPSCVIHGSVFSLMPTDRRDRWSVTSLSPSGWQQQAGDLDIHAEWNRFLDQLSLLERRSCFPRSQTFYSMRRAIAEKIPLPANEAAFFSYSFSGSGFVDLAPGMQLKIEQPLIQSATSTARGSYKGSLEADYRVAAPSDLGVELLLYHTVNRKAAKSFPSGADLVFDVSKRFRSWPFLRLFLQSIGDSKTQPTAILLGARTVGDLQEATLRVEAAGRTNCPSSTPSSVECVSFGTKTAVSLLSSVSINGTTELRPFGTTFGYLIDVAGSAKGHNEVAAETHLLRQASLHRSLVQGGYAEVDFRKTLDSVNQIVLLPGDKVAWEQ